MTRIDISQAIGGISVRHIQEADTYFKEKFHPISLRRTFVIAAILITVLSLCAFTYVTFTTLAGDNLILTAVYKGDGIISAEIESQSNRTLILDPTARLLYYSDHMPVEANGQLPTLSALKIPANSKTTIEIDIHDSYDIHVLESIHNDHILLQLTNKHYLIGQKWTCMISFSPYAEDYVPKYTKAESSGVTNEVPTSFKAYFENYTPDVFARWVDASEYMELVEAELAEFDGNIVSPVNPLLIVHCLDYPAATQESCFDGYNKLLGRNETEKISQISIHVPNVFQGELNGTQAIPIFYLYKYAVSDIQSEDDYAFIRGNLLTFREMEDYKVYEDSEYVVYEMHHLVYEDLTSYVEEMCIQNSSIYLNSEIWKRIQNFYHVFSNREYMEKQFCYIQPNQNTQLPLSTDDVIKISEKGSTLSYEDLKDYDFRWTDIDEPKGLGMSFEIDDDYELFYAMNPDGTEKGFYLYHNPTSDKIDIRYENVPAFIEAHGKPEPRCECTDTQHGNHSWHLTLDWILEKENRIKVNDFISACNQPVNGKDFITYHYPVDTDYHLEVCWYVYDENGEAICTDENIIIVHEATNDYCDPRSENVAEFIKQHS